jgi:hypothetical protein
MDDTRKPISQVPASDKLTHNSDKRFNELQGINDPSANPPPGAVYGTYSWPRTLNRYFYQATPMSGSICTTKCASLGFSIADTNDNMCCKSDFLSRPRLIDFL